MNKSQSNISINSLKRALVIRENMEELQTELDQLLGGAMPVVVGKKRTMSAAGRAAVAAAQKARWAKLKEVVSVGPKKKARRKMTPTAKAKISAAAKLRWKKIKAEGKKHL